MNYFNSKVCFKTSIDGNCVHGQLVACGRDEVVEGINVSSTIYRPFTFGNLTLTGKFSWILCLVIELMKWLEDDDSAKELYGNNIGCIEVAVRRFVQGSEIKGKVTDGSNRIQDCAIHERSKKAGAHRVKLVTVLFPHIINVSCDLHRLGAATERTAIKQVTVDYIDSLEKPYAKFRFLYRPRGTSVLLLCGFVNTDGTSLKSDLLQAQGIIPAPTPTQSAEASPNGEQRHRHNGDPPQRSASPSERRGGIRGRSVSVKQENHNPHLTDRAMIEKEVSCWTSSFRYARSSEIHRTASRRCWLRRRRCRTNLMQSVRLLELREKHPQSVFRTGQLVSASLLTWPSSD